MFAGRHIPEKRVPLVVEAIRLAKRDIPELKGVIFGRGPQTELVREMCRDLDYISLPGFVEASVLSSTMGRAACLLHPSEREGYGMVVIEAAAMGVPSVLVDGPDNAAAELVEDGGNGFVVPAPSADLLAQAVVRAYRAGEPLRLGITLAGLLPNGPKCMPLAGAVIDVWHTDATGLYSNVGKDLQLTDTTGQTFSRGH